MGYSCALGTTIAMILMSSLASAEPSPRAELEKFFRDATVILSEATNAKQARDNVRDLAQALFDGRGAARRALGPEWDKRTSAEREEFTRMFSGVLGHAYLELVLARLPRDGPPPIRVIGEAVSGGRAAVVLTRVQARDGSDIQLEYMMRRADEAWLVHDVVIDGFSLIENYRAQFARVLRTSSYAELAGRLRAVKGAGRPIAASPTNGARPDDVVAYFDTSRAELSPVAHHDLERAAAWLVANRGARGLVEGHSDQRGDPHLNQALAERRANAIREHLVTRGVDPDRIAVVTYGYGRPVCSKALETCWAENRRAVLRLTP